MFYYSSRNKKLTASSADAILQGIAPDGGLYLPSDFEEAMLQLEDIINMTSCEISTEILSRFFSDFTYI